MSTARPSQLPEGEGAAVATGAGLAAGLGAIVASSCCVLPIVFVGLGLGSIAAVLIPMLAALRPWLLAAAMVAVVAAWVTYFRRRRTCSISLACAMTSAGHRTPLWLLLASAIVLLALSWQSWIEPQLLRWMR